MTNATESPAPIPAGDGNARPLDARVNDALALLEEIAADRDRLLGIPADPRLRFLRAAGEVSRPDAVKRRQVIMSTKRQKKIKRRERVAEIEAHSSLLASTSSEEPATTSGPTRSKGKALAPKAVSEIETTG